jgi:hypothetical protein
LILSFHLFAIIRYASLFFVAGVSSNANELLILEIIHRYVEVLDRYFGNVRPALIITQGQRCFFLIVGL